MPTLCRTVCTLVVPVIFQHDHTPRAKMAKVSLHQTSHSQANRLALSLELASSANRLFLAT